MKKMIQLTLTLTAIAAIAGVSIASIYDKTKDVISEQKQANLDSALESLFPNGSSISADSLTLEDGSQIRYWVAERTDLTLEESSLDSTSSPIIGYAIEGGSYGYSSVVKCITAVSANGTVLGLSILSQEETPGLGSRATESVSDAIFWDGPFKKRKKNEPWFQAQFRGLNIMDTLNISDGAEWHTLSEEGREQLQKDNEVSAITGATITTKAVTLSLTQLSIIVKEINSNLAADGEIQ